MTIEYISSPIPKMTHPLSKGWDQPDHKKFSFTRSHVHMEKHEFDQLKEYSCTQPSGVYEGKMWKSKDNKGRWWLRWFDSHPTDESLCVTKVRRISITSK